MQDEESDGQRLQQQEQRLAPRAVGQTGSVGQLWGLWGSYGAYGAAMGSGQLLWVSMGSMGQL